MFRSHTVPSFGPTASNRKAAILVHRTRFLLDQGTRTRSGSSSWFRSCANVRACYPGNPPATPLLRVRLVSAMSQVPHSAAFCLEELFSVKNVTGTQSSDLPLPITKVMKSSLTGSNGWPAFDQSLNRRNLHFPSSRLHPSYEAWVASSRGMRKAKRPECSIQFVIATYEIKAQILN